MTRYTERRRTVEMDHVKLIARPNAPVPGGNGIFERWENPVLTAGHVPLDWRYDLSPDNNPYFMERLGVNAVFNPGAIRLDGKVLLCARIEGSDRKSFFAIAESARGTEGFRFWPKPISLPETEEPDTNVYDMRLVQHEDGFIYGLFCTERKDPGAPDDLSAAIAQCGIARTRDLVDWERLPDLVTSSGQQRNVVLHPEFVDGKYAFYTRPQAGFIEVGSGGGIGWGLSADIAGARIENEIDFDRREYHTVSEVKNGLGPAPIKTRAGWLHLAHGVRDTAAGLRYVLYCFLAERDRPWIITHKPQGYLIAPEGEERVGDVGNVVFSNGWVVDDDGRVFIYYASSDTRVHLATSSVERLIDYCFNTPSDALTSAGSVDQRLALIEANRSFSGSFDA